MTTHRSQAISSTQVIPDTEDAKQAVVSTLNDIFDSFVEHLPLLFAGVVIILGTALLSLVANKVIEGLLKGVRLRPSLKALLVRFAVFGLWAFGLLLAAMVTFPGLTPTRALTALGVGSIAIGLAFKDIFENFFAGVLILWRFPFENGDFICVTGITGRVVDVTVRNTILRTVDGELVVIPNADLYKNPVEVLTSKPVRRCVIVCGIAYGESIGTARSLIASAVESCETVAKEHEVRVFAQAFASSSIDFEIAWWTGSTPLEQRESRDEVVEAVKIALDNAGIEIPFPHRTLFIRSDDRAELESPPS